MEVRRNVFLILVIINCILIFYFSNQVADVSSNSSGRVVNFIVHIIPHLKNMPDDEKELICSQILQPIVRKTAHFSIYTMLGFFIMNFALTFKQYKYRNFAISWGIGTLYAITDEFHQCFVPGRSCELRDMCIDSLGVFTGIVIAILCISMFRKINKLVRNHF